MNARLAARLTGWKIDIQSDTEFAQAEADAAFGGGGAEGEDFSGRCAAILSNGKRCPNAALPGSRYCGVPAHQALAAPSPAAERRRRPPSRRPSEAEELESSDRSRSSERDARAETAPVAEVEPERSPPRSS